MINAFLDRYSRRLTVAEGDPDVLPLIRNAMRDEIKSLSSLRHRLAAIAFGKLVSLSPGIAQARCTKLYREVGLDLIGMGFQSDVIRDGDMVRKIVYGSQDWDDEHKERKVKDMARDDSVARKHLDRVAFLPEQYFDISPHPLYPAKTAVMSSQRLVAFEPLDWQVEVPEHLIEPLRRFGQANQKMRKASGYMADLSGVDNLGMVEGHGLTLVDTVPIPIKQQPKWAELNALAHRRADYLASL